MQALPDYQEEDLLHKGLLRNRKFFSVWALPPNSYRVHLSLRICSSRFSRVGTKWLQSWLVYSTLPLDPLEHISGFCYSMTQYVFVFLCLSATQVF